MYALGFSAMLHTTKCNFPSKNVFLLIAFKLIAGIVKATRLTFKIKTYSLSIGIQNYAERATRSLPLHPFQLKGTFCWHFTCIFETQSLMPEIHCFQN